MDCGPTRKAISMSPTASAAGCRNSRRSLRRILQNWSGEFCAMRGARADLRDHSLIAKQAPCGYAGRTVFSILFLDLAALLFVTYPSKSRIPVSLVRCEESYDRMDQGARGGNPAR